MRFFILVFLFSQSIFANSLIEVNFEGKSIKTSKIEARKEIFDQAINEVSLRYITEVIGEDRVEKNKRLIENKIIKNYLKYIPIMKTSDFKSQGKELKSNVFLKISIDELKQLLLKEGLFYDMAGEPRVIPFISISDRVNSRSFSWWSSSDSEEHLFLREQLISFHQRLKNELRNKSFFGMSPVDKNFVAAVPESFRSENMRKDDYLFLGHFFHSSIVVKGSIKFSPRIDLADAYKIDIQLVALHSSNGRVIAEVIRSYETEVGSFKQIIRSKLNDIQEKIVGDLVVQILDTWQKGTFGSRLIQLTVKGDLDYNQLHEFRKLFLQKVKGVSGLRDRLLMRNSYTYEVDSSATAEGLAKRIKQENFPKYKVEVANVGNAKLEIRVKAW